ncbi:MAG: hypothetical protein IKH88_15730 [Prevotella sp.]|nr:hypothetical protein [Prevotella sp.]
MKKILIGMMAFALFLGMHSCKKEATPASNETPSTEQSSQTAGEAPETTNDTTGKGVETPEATEQATKATEATGQSTDGPSKAAADLLAKAKKEGANWSVDEWKAAFREMLMIAKPMMTDLADMLKYLETDQNKALEIAKNIETKYAGIDKVSSEFEEFAKTTPNGKNVADDNEWKDNLKKELGIPTDI